MPQLIKTINKILVKPLLWLIRLYQHTLSPDRGWFRAYHPLGFCPYKPHCSQYSYESLAKYGLWPGVFKSVARVLRCHPWTKGGYDPVL